jgi:hypothetical protein
MRILEKVTHYKADFVFLLSTFFGLQRYIFKESIIGNFT